MASGTAGVSPFGFHYGGFWIRLGARMFDGLVLGVPMLILAAVVMPSLIRGAQSQAPNAMVASFVLTFFLGYFLILICYEVLMLKYRGGTLGKMVCGIKVVRADGSGLGWGVSFGRFFMWNVVTSGIPYINFIVMLISSIMAGTDAEKRALHDRVCGTRVIYK
jgi:uncharacterized RDD family membrane protein YckC